MAKQKKKHKDTDSKKKKKMLPARVEAVEWVGKRFRLVDILAKGCRGWNGSLARRLKLISAIV
jgi:hypothetical protein